MDIRPQDLPELRAEAMLGQDGGGYTLKQWLLLAQRKGFGSDEARGMWRHEIERLATADLFYVSPGMVQLAQAAAASLPSFTIQPEDLPSRSGLIVFGADIQGGIRVQKEPGGPGEESCTRALLWNYWPQSAEMQGLYVTGYMDRDIMLEGAIADGELEQAANIRREPRLVLVADAGFTIPFGDKGWQELPEQSAVTDLLPILLAVWLLMRQPLARTTDIEPDRATRKRLRRAGQESKPVRVIELRRAPSSSSQGDGESNYHHQWIVKGHWRQHWYPKREVHRPVWIAPHIKGPEGAPLIGGEKVYALKR